MVPFYPDVSWVHELARQPPLHTHRENQVWTARLLHVGPRTWHQKSGHWIQGSQHKSDDWAIPLIPWNVFHVLLILIFLVENENHTGSTYPGVEHINVMCTYTYKVATSNCSPQATTIKALDHRDWSSELPACTRGHVPTQPLGTWSKWVAVNFCLDPRHVLTLSQGAPWQQALILCLPRCGRYWPRQHFEVRFERTRWCKFCILHHVIQSKTS